MGIAKRPARLVAAGELAQSAQPHAGDIVLALELLQLLPIERLARDHCRKQPPFLVIDVLLKLRAQLREFATQLVQLGAGITVDRGSALGKLRQAWQIPAQPVVVLVNDVRAKVGQRGARPVGPLQRDRLDLPLEENNDGLRIEALFSARLDEAATTAAAVVEAQLRQHPRRRGTFENELGEAVRRIDRHRRTPFGEGGAATAGNRSRDEFILTV